MANVKDNFDKEDGQIEGEALGSSWFVREKVRRDMPRKGKENALPRLTAQWHGNLCKQIGQNNVRAGSPSTLHQKFVCRGRYLLFEVEEFLRRGSEEL